MDGAPKSDPIRIAENVISAGNSWIICRSKTHGDRVYYFNTLTGEAAWNLSEVEIQKARQWTKNLANQSSNFVPQEPMDPPIDNPSDELDNSINTARNNISSTVYNKQVINNRYSRQAFPVTPFMIPPCDQVVQNGMLLPVGVNAPVNLNSFSNGVWAIPPQHYYLTPTALLRQAQTSANEGYKNDHPSIQVQNTSTTLNGRFHSMRTEQKYSNLSQRNMYHGKMSRDNKRGANRNGYQRPVKRNLGKNDLRKLLSTKKNQKLLEQSTSQEFQGECSGVNYYSSENEDYNDQSESEIEMDPRSHSSIKSGSDTHVDAHSDWLKENVIFKGVQLVLDLSNLKKLAKPGVDADCWFIVTDEDIFLNHLIFLNIFCNSDELCQLMVPQQVMLKLRKLAFSDVSSRTSIRARRALAFIKQLLDSSYVMIGDGIGDTDSDYLLDCCLNLIGQNYFVILLSDNTELKSHVNSTEIHTFTINELQQFLKKIPTTELMTENPRVQSLKKQIKIIVPNDLTRNPDQDATNLVRNDSQLVVDSDVAQCSHVPDTLVPIPQEDRIAQVMRTHSGTQLQETASTSRILEHCNITTKPPRLSKDEESNNDVIDNPPQIKRREIRLNRSLSSKTPTKSEVTEAERSKRQFKWRKRRNTDTKPQQEPAGNSEVNLSKEPTQTETINQKVLTSNEFNENQSDGQTNKLFSKQANDGPTPAEIKKDLVLKYVNNLNEHQLCYQSPESFGKQTNDVAPANNTEGSETSSFPVQRTASNDRIIVDETSTSGIVSNTTSNVDSESDRKLNDINQPETREQERAALMFVVRDQNMEDYLSMRSDEWVSRFLQIMEEVLTQVLRRDEHFLRNVVYKLHGGGPWTIREATDCVKRMFSDNCDIIDAADMLENIFMKISDNSGRININLKPSEFMEMYSYGVCLVEMLQTVLRDCEDLQAAVLSLEKLLRDIQNPNADGHHENFDENVQEPQVSNTSQIPNDKPPEQIVQAPLPKESKQNDSPRGGSNRSQKGSPQKGSPQKGSPQKGSPQKGSPQKGSDNPKTPTQERNLSRYNLRCRDKQPAKEKNQSPETDKIAEQTERENSFFSNLNLIKKANDQNQNSNQPCQESVTTDTAQIAQDSTSNLDLNKNIEETNTSTNDIIQPKIIRKFTVCPEYEKMLLSIQREALDLDALDYTAAADDDVDCLNDEYCSDNELIDDDENANPKESIHGLRRFNSKYSDTFKIQPVATYENEGDRAFLQPSPDDINNKMKRIFANVLKGVKGRILDVRTFCINARTELLDTDWTNNRKMKMHDLATKMKVLIDTLCQLLNRIYCRETYEPENNIQSVLKTASINDQDLDHNQLHVYRDVIGRYLQQARILQESIVLIIKVVDDKPVN